MKYTSNYNRRGKVERVLDLIWNIITVKGAVTTVASYCGEKLGEAKEQHTARSTAIVAAVAVSIVVGICTGLVVTNSQATNEQSEATRRLNNAREQLVELEDRTSKFLRNYEQRQREREVLEKGRRDLMSNLRSQYGS